MSGTYALTSLRTLGNLGGGGNGLPVTFHDGSGSTLTFKSGALVLAADGSYTLEVEAEFNGGDVSMTDEGNYDTAGSTIDFTPTGSPARMKDGTIQRQQQDHRRHAVRRDPVEGGTGVSLAHRAGVRSSGAAAGGELDLRSALADPLSEPPGGEIDPRGEAAKFPRQKGSSSSAAGGRRIVKTVRQVRARSGGKQGRHTPPAQSETFVHAQRARSGRGLALFFDPRAAAHHRDEGPMNNVKTFVLMAGLMGLFLLAGQLLGGSQRLILAAGLRRRLSTSGCTSSPTGWCCGCTARRW